MRGVNRVTIVGNLGNDPEVRATTSGGRVATISVATSESWTDKNTGQKQEKTEWHRIVFFNRLAEIVEQYFTKGSQVYVSGKLQTRKWQDSNGQDKYTTEVVANEMQMLGGKGGGQSSSSAASQQGAGPDINFDDDIPFAPVSSI